VGATVVVTATAAGSVVATALVEGAPELSAPHAVNNSAAGNPIA
jgi:hypothetical protein